MKPALRDGLSLKRYMEDAEPGELHSLLLHILERLDALEGEPMKHKTMALGNDPLIQEILERLRKVEQNKSFSRWRDEAREQDKQFERDTLKAELDYTIKTSPPYQALIVKYSDLMDKYSALLERQNP